MRPIDYFNDFDASVKTLNNTDDVIQKIEAAQKLISSAAEIVQKGYHLRLLKMFETGFEQADGTDIRNMYEIWLKLLNHNIESIKMAGDYHASFAGKIGLLYITAMNQRSALAEHKEALLSLINEMAEEEDISHLLSGIKCIAKSTAAPLDTIVYIIKVFHENSEFLQEEAPGLN